MRSVPTTSVRPMPRKKPSGILRLLTWMRNSPTGRRRERLGDDERHLGLEVRGQLADVDDVDVGLGELAEPPLLRPLPAPHLLDLVAAEREGELAGVLEHVAREGHGEVEVQAQRGIPAAVVAREPADAVDLLVGVAALAEQPLDRLDGPGLERREAVQLEDLADDVEEVQLEEALARAGARGTREIGVTLVAGALTRSILAGRGWWPARGRIVVAAPWPVSTSVESGSGSTTSRSERCIASLSPPGRSVRPIEPANSTSPLTMVRSSPSSAAGRRAPRRARTSPSPRCGPGRAAPRRRARPARAPGGRSTSTTRSGSRQVARWPNCCSSISSRPGITLPSGSCRR